MKKLALLILIILSVSISLSAQYKTVKKSGRTPKWVNSLEKDFIIVSGSGATINLAKDDALNRVKENIIKSIADNVRSETKLSKSEINDDDIYESFTNTITSISGKIDFISGLSMINVEDFYWEKIKNKKTKKYHYNYHLKYPFASSEMYALIDEYKFKDNELSKELNKYIDELDTVGSIEEIKGNIDALRILKKNFIDKREDISDVTIQKYINLIREADIEEIANKAELFKFAILINKNRINSSINPKITSNCATITSNTKEFNVWTIKYDVKDCFEDETNYIKISFKFPFSQFKKKIFFNVGDTKFNLKVNNTIQIKSFKTDQGIEYKTYINLNSDYPSAFIVESVILEFKNMSPIKIHNISKGFAKHKQYNLIFSIDLSKKQIEKIESLTKLNGYIIYRSAQSEEEKTYRIYKNKFYLD